MERVLIYFNQTLDEQYFFMKGHLKECLTIHVLLPFDYCFGRRTIVKFPPILGTDAVS